MIFSLIFSNFLQGGLKQFESNGKIFLDNIATVVHNVFFVLFFLALPNTYITSHRATPH